MTPVSEPRRPTTKPSKRAVNSQSVNANHEGMKPNLTLLTLPAEIWLEIYDLLFGFDRQENPC
jgi:hypothetical protein